METWSNEELLRRWQDVSSELVSVSNQVMPVLLKLSKLEREIQILREEIINRGITTNEGKGE